MRREMRVWCLCSVFVLASVGIHAKESPKLYRKAEARYQLPKALLYAIALTESGTTLRSGQYVPWPWTLNVQGEPRFFPTRKAALRNLYRLKQKGIRSVDIGLSQINWRWHSDKFATFNDALDPEKNIMVAAAILSNCYRQRQQWVKAVGCYHSPNNKERARRYAKKVYAKWDNL